MVISCPIKLLEKVIEISKAPSLYVIGAGASSQYIQSSCYDLYEYTKKIIIPNITCVSADKPKTLSDTERSRLEISGHVIHGDRKGNFLIDDTDIDIADLYIRQNPNVLELAALLKFSLLKKMERCPEYEFLKMTHKYSIFLNLNHDSLCETFTNNRKIITLHGRIPIGYKLKIEHDLRNILDDSLGNQVETYIPPELYTAAKEMEHLLLKKEKYQELINILNERNFTYIVIIGYSFFKRNSHEINDVLTYDLIRDFYIKRRCMIVIIDPTPDYIADMLCKTLHISSMFLYKIRWDCFTWSYFDFFKKNTFSKISSHELIIFNHLYDCYKGLNKWYNLT